VPRLLLARALRTDVGISSFLAIEGIRRDFQDAAFWTSLGPPRDVRPPWAPVPYQPDLTASHPQVRFGAAAVGMARERGVRVLVVVTPMPWEWLAWKERYDAPAIQAQIDVLRREIEARDGQLLDLHEAMTQDGFRDIGGHFNDVGTDRMEALVWRRI